MSNKKLTDLTATTSLATSDLTYVVQGGISKKTTLQQISDLIGTGGTGFNSVVNRTTLTTTSSSAGVVYLKETGREGVFVWNSNNLSSLVSVDTLQGVYVPPSSAPSGASGAWVRIYSDVFQAKWFGGTWDGIANDGPVINAAIALSNALVGTNILGYGGGVPAIQLPFAPNGIYCGTNTILITQATRLRGYSGGDFGGEATLLKFDAACHGIQIDGANACIEGIQVKGAWTFNAGMSEGEFHGFKAHRRFSGRDIGAWNFQGDGLHVNISGGSGGDTEGNDNDVYVERAVFNSNRNGISFAGADSNACTFISIDANYNRQAGIFDNSFLGNTHIGHETSGNGVQSETSQTFPYTCCYNNGHVFYVVIGQETGASTNSPPSTATNNTYWRWWKDAGSAPAYAPQWVTGLTWRAGGAYLSSRLNGQGLYINPYVESDQPPVQLGQNDFIVGGQGTLDLFTRSILGNLFGIQTSPQLYVKGNFFNIQGSGNSFQVDSSAAGADAGLTINNGNFSGITLYQFNGVVYSQLLNSRSLGWYQYINSGLQYVRNINGSAVETLGGTGYRLLAGSLGYGTGAGGAVTQTTDKTTAVTLNKASGQITMNGAALAANTAVSFTMNNSQIEATDTISISISSAATAGAYVITVDAVASGSCRISVRNLSAGSLSEAIILNYNVIKGANS